jgi:hypothetical protein
VRLFTAEGVGRREIHHLMSAVYGEHSMSRSGVMAWHKRFREGLVSLKDDARPGQAHRVITPDDIATLDGHIHIKITFKTDCKHKNNFVYEYSTHTFFENSYSRTWLP